MAFFVVLLSVEALLLLLTAPWKIRVQGYFSLERPCLLVKVSLGRLRLVSVKASIEKERIRISVNGKKPKKRKSRMHLPQGAVSKVMKAFAEMRIMRAGDVSLYVGAQEALTGALGVSAVENAFRDVLRGKGRSAVFWDCERQRLDLDLRLGLRISLLQTAIIGLSVVSRKKR